MGVFYAQVHNINVHKGSSGCYFKNITPGHMLWSAYPQMLKVPG